MNPSFIQLLLTTVSPKKLFFSLPPQDTLPKPHGTQTEMLHGNFQLESAFQKIRLAHAKSPCFNYQYPDLEPTPQTISKPIFSLSNPRITHITESRDAGQSVITKTIVLSKSAPTPAHNGNAWGAVMCENASEAPPEFSAKPESTDSGYKIVDIKFNPQFVISMIKEDSKCWEDAPTDPAPTPATNTPTPSWGAASKRFQVRGETSLDERKFWAFEHELDHLAMWEEYWKLMANYITKAAQMDFETVDKCNDYINKIKRNNHLNWQIAKFRSMLFDWILFPEGKSKEDAALPGRYYKVMQNKGIHFPPDLEYVWWDADKISGYGKAT